MEQRRYVVGAELRAANTNGDFTIEGTAVRYGALSQLNCPATGMREQVAPGCFRASIASGQEVLALRDHDQSQILGRTRNGSLTLQDGPDALRFSIRLNPAVVAHRDTYQLVKDGTLSEMSFGFGAEEDDLEAMKDERGKFTLRTVRRAKLYDVSVVSSPAYAGSTSAEARSLAYRYLPAGDLMAELEEIDGRYQDNLNRIRLEAQGREIERSR